MFLNLFMHQVNKMPEYFKVRIDDVSLITKIWEKQLYSIKTIYDFQMLYNMQLDFFYYTDLCETGFPYHWEITTKYSTKLNTSLIWD